jgi:large subunit ribosomal protein L18
MKVKTKKDARKRRHNRIRKKVSGTADRPRVALMVSNKNIYAQAIDDTASVTLASVASKKDECLNVETAKRMGSDLAEALKGKSVSTVVVDRGGFKFHGRVKTLVDAMIEGGISLSSKEEK